MKNIALILLLMLCLNSCKSSKGVTTKKTKDHKASEVVLNNFPKSADNKSDSLANSIIDFAKQFDGVKYKYGGTTKKGMDCSGLITTAFKSQDIMLPRSSKNMANIGSLIEIREVQKGDLLFFAIQKNSDTINHVGLVTDVRPGFVEFIHATTSLGVIISSLAERYWHFAFVQARRIL